MKANAISLLAVFERKMRLEVPLFQRQYRWTREEQWEPLWEDIKRKFGEYLDGQRESPVHFLGAMVLDQKQMPMTHVEKRQVIDGQQRLTTLQIFLAAFRDLCREHGREDLGKECDTYTVNKGLMANPNVEKFKVWPTQLDREDFADVICAGSRAALEAKHPLTKKSKRARKWDPRPGIVEAYLYFHGELSAYFIGTPADPPVYAEYPLASRLDECFQALKNAFQVVVIDLEGDDAQVIFETLNARGAPLLPADLVRNHIFLRAARKDEPAEELYASYWERFDDPFWAEVVQQGRLSRPRSDLFLQHFLSGRLGRDIPARHLFVEYKKLVEGDKDGKKPFLTVRDELTTIARQGEVYRRILEPANDDVMAPLATFLNSFDMSTVHPLLLFLAETGVDKAGWVEIGSVLESYLLRRAVCDLSVKNYTRVFLTLTRRLRDDGPSAANVRRYLAELSGDGLEWPSDSRFREEWLSGNAYVRLSNRKLVYVLLRLSDTFSGPKTERVMIDGQLSVEHILPQSWVSDWPLADGSAGLAPEEMEDNPEDAARIESSRKRNRLIQTMGNLTILTQALNSSVSNGPWRDKRPALLAASLLPLNLQLTAAETWDDTAIEERSAKLFDRALALWPGPGR